MSADSLPDLADQIAVEEVVKDSFVSRCLPQRTGNAAPIAYGGCAISVAIYAACKTVRPELHAYSVLGNFLGPTRIDQHINCVVTRCRDTKSFATRRVTASQKLPDGSERACVEFLIDFHVREAALLHYSAAPPKPHAAGPDDRAQSLPTEDILEAAVSDGRINRKAAKAFTRFFGLMIKHLETRYCLEGVSTQNVLGLAKHTRTTQDDLPIYEKSTAEWIRTKQKLPSPNANVAALGFTMDAALSFLPLHLDHKSFEDSAACSTLDFALRIMTPDIDMSCWHLRERKTIAAHGGRTISEGRLWGKDGQLVAIMSQTSILRPLPQAQL